VISRRSDSGAAFAAALLLTVVGGSLFNIMPLLTASAVDTLGFSDRQAGLLSLAISIGSGVSAICAVGWVRSWNWRRAAALGLGGMLAACAPLMLAHAYPLFVLLQGVAGFFGAAVVCLGVTILSDRREPARGFGMANALQVIYQICTFLLGPTLLRIGGLGGVMALLALLCALALLLVPLLPDRGRPVRSLGGSRGLLRPATLLALLGFGAYFVNAGAYWTYVQIMGEASGIPPGLAATCVAVGASAGILGGATAWLVGERFGSLRPILLSCLLTLGSGFLLRGSFGATAFVTSVLLYFFAWNYAVAYQLSMVNTVDATGRGVAITQALAFLGAAGGAGLAALLVSPGHYGAVIGLVALNACLSTASFALALRLHQRSDAPGALSEAPRS